MNRNIKSLHSHYELTKRCLMNCNRSEKKHLIRINYRSDFDFVLGDPSQVGNEFPEHDFKGEIWPMRYSHGAGWDYGGYDLRKLAEKMGMKPYVFSKEGEKLSIVSMTEVRYMWL